MASFDSSLGFLSGWSDGLSFRIGAVCLLQVLDTFKISNPSSSLFTDENKINLNHPGAAIQPEMFQAKIPTTSAAGHVSSA